MKKYLFLGLAVVVALGIGALLATGNLPFVDEGTAMVQAFDGTAETQAKAVTEAPAGAKEEKLDIVAEAVVVPARYATLSMSASGNVAEVPVQEGDAVQAGQVLVRLRDRHQRAAVAEAEAALASARAALAAREAGPRSQEVASAEAGLEAAQARLARLQEGARAEEISAARASLRAAQETLKRLYAGPEAHTRIAAEANLANAEAALRQAQAAYDRVKNEPNLPMLPQSLQLEQATNAYEAAQAGYDALFAAPDEDVVAQAQAQVKAAQANLDRLLEPVTENEIAEAEAMVQQAQSALDLVRAGAREEEIAVAQAAVAQAEAVLQQAQASLADTELRAPFAGTVASIAVKAGEQVVAGQPIVRLADLSQWQIETDDLTELDIVRVQPGDRVVLTFDAIKGLELSGTVLRIKAIGEEKQGDVTYTVIVQPDEQDPRLRWNMTAVVTIP